MITSDTLLHIAVTFMDNKNPSIIQHLIEIAYRVRELESKEIIGQKPEPESIDFMKKKYADLMDTMVEKESMQTYVDSMKYAMSKVKEDAFMDPAVKAEEILEDDSKKWAREFLTAPTDTSMDKAEELRKRHSKKR